MPQRDCETCGNPYDAKRKTARFCSDRCRYHNHLSKRKRVTIPADLRFRVLRRDGFRCRYCGDTPDKKMLRVDHIKSLADGGHRTAILNLITTCQPCNAGKSSLSLELDEIPPLPVPDGK